MMMAMAVAVGSILNITIKLATNPMIPTHFDILKEGRKSVLAHFSIAKARLMAP